MELKISYSSQNEDDRLSPISLSKHDKKYKQIQRQNDRQQLNKSNNSIRNTSTSGIKPQKDTISTKSGKRNKQRDFSDDSVDEIHKNQFSLGKTKSNIKEHEAVKLYQNTSSDIHK